jgi:GNAT superfamily N-acetyltransferase
VRSLAIHPDGKRRGIGKMLETLDLLARKKHHGIKARALLTLYTGRSEFVKEVVENIRKNLGIIPVSIPSGKDLVRLLLFPFWFLRNLPLAQKIPSGLAKDAQSLWKRI